MALKSAAPGILMLLLLSSCALTSQSDGTDSNNTTSKNLTNATDPTGYSTFGNATWAKLTKNNAEGFCYLEAKEEAAEDSWAVKGCICDELAENGMKAFECDVFSFEPSLTKHHIRLTCFHGEQTCTMESNLETKTFTFAEIAPLLD